MSLNIRKLHQTIGAEITGIKLSEPLSQDILLEIKFAWGQYGLLVFPNQPLSKSELTVFAQEFGEIDAQSQGNVRSAQKYEILLDASNVSEKGDLLSANDAQTKYSLLNCVWHSDRSYRLLPSRGTILHGVEILEGSGDTLFADLRTAYEKMPSDLKAKISDRIARHNFGYGLKQVDLPSLTPEEQETMWCEHPLERHHSDGSISLFLSPLYMESIIGLSDTEAKELIEKLTQWSTQEGFVYRHQWQPYDLLLWDNRWTMHKVTSYDITRQRRKMHRIVLNGTEPVCSLAS